MKYEGGCLCGANRYCATGTPFEITHCHCDNCRCASGAAFVTWASFLTKNFRFTKGRPGKFKSSAHGSRSFCRRCGTALTFVDPKKSHETDITVGSLDRPERISPESHTWFSRRLKWIRVADKLPKFPRGLPK